MGLAASQARLLGLTARKSNVEYKGQQINQQRTALSNEVMGLYEEYNKLKPPVPPSVTDYQQTTYTVDSTSEGYQITNFTKILDGEYEGYYNVTLNYLKDVPKMYTATKSDSVITIEKDEEEGYSYLNLQFGIETYTYDKDNPTNSTITKITQDYEKYQGLSTIMSSLGKTDGTYYMYMKEGTAYYIPETDLDDTEFEDVDGKQMYYGSYLLYYQGKQTKNETVNAVAALTQEASGRLSTIYFVESDDPDLINTTHSITTGTAEDEASYSDAMNQYYYNKQVYEKETERINLKTKTLQEEDRGLELQLNQLDTEQKAISTEMESIDKVIEKTVETVFKTYE